MFTLAMQRYRIYCQQNSSEAMEEYAARAELVERVIADSSDGAGRFAFAVSEPSIDEWPSVVVLGSYEPAQSGFYPGALVVPEEGILFVGAGRYVAAFDLGARKKLWEEVAEVGFWFWERHGSTVLMAAELELSAWNTQGNKLWSTFVEPPWSFSVEVDRVRLDVMGAISTFGLVSGPETKNT